jgi:hypothetical protein
MSDASNSSTLVPHPNLGTVRANVKMGFCTLWSTTLSKCPCCSYGVWNLHQPFKDDSLAVCGWCFNDVRVKGIFS